MNLYTVDVANLAAHSGFIFHNHLAAFFDFFEFGQQAGQTPPETVAAWNSHAKSHKQHVFIRSVTK